MNAPCGGCGGRKGENELLDDMDFDRYGKVKCSKIEGMLPKLMKMVEGEEKLGSCIRVKWIIIVYDINQL